MRAIDWFPLLLSIQVSLLATLLNFVAGVAVGWCLARRRIPGREVLSALVAAPLILPPTVLGYYLLVLLGRGTVIGSIFEALGIPLVFSWRGAVIASAIASFPFVAQASRAAFEAVDVSLEQVARTLGRSEWEVFWLVTFPLAWQGIVGGTLLAFARAIGDFGATLMVAGNIPGKTQTLSIAIYDAVQANDLELAALLVAILSVFSIALLAAVQTVSRKLVASPP
ncbi:MAG: molybdate ABC transporter permease subunit [Chloroflexota bacterium]|nr:molybdate ABC transporter permease subunit [Dehalococcoidia bacterium]MDW8252250.1 molybdate ABC transporter permease subunit [Chloroflexota bacterium]